MLNCIVFYIYIKIIAFHFAEGDPREAAEQLEVSAFPMTSNSPLPNVVLDSARRLEHDGDLQLMSTVNRAVSESMEGFKSF
jgi:hypothetical protein